MTLPLERPRNRKPITWLTVIGILLLPAVIGGILVAALSDPVERLDTMRTAIVNEDDPVEIDGQIVPLGRQLTAGLVEGSDEFDSNLDWTISNAEDAADGLADGRYTAVVTIPEAFSAAATSTSPGATPTQATIEVETAPDAKIADGLITSEIARAAADLMGQQLTGVYLENVLLGFTTLGDQLGEAADGATQLAEGARTAATGAGDLGDGAGQLATGAGTLAGGIGELAGGAGELAGGARQLAGGIGELAGGLDQISAGASQAGAAPEQLAQAVSALDGYGSGLATSVAGSAQRLAAAAQTCVDEGGSAALCGELAALAQTAADDARNAGAVAAITGQLSTGVDALREQLPALTGVLTEAASGVRALATGADQLAAGIGELQTGAGALQSGAGELQNGATALQGGAGELSTGIGELADGTGTLAEGLEQATAALPRYSESEAADLASVVADPVAAEGTSTGLFGEGTIPLLSAVALWFGALATFIVQRALPSTTLTSRRSSLSLALRAFAPAAVIGALQGLLVAGVAQFAAGYDVATWAAFAGLSALTGVAFAAVVQALVAVIGGFGRGAAAVIGVIALATGVVSTVPVLLSTLAGALPTAPAVAALTGAVTGAGGIGSAAAGLLAWAAVSFLVTLVVVSLRRSTSPRALLRPAV